MSEHNMDVWILKTDGSAIRAEDAPFIYYKDTGWELSLDWARKQIGNDCSIAELVRLPFGDLWVDEEGLFQNPLQVNDMATTVYHSAVPTTDPIVGNAILVMKRGSKMERELAATLVQLAKK